MTMKSLCLLLPALLLLSCDKPQPDSTSLQSAVAEAARQAESEAATAAAEQKIERKSVTPAEQAGLDRFTQEFEAIRHWLLTPEGEQQMQGKNSLAAGAIIHGKLSAITADGTPADFTAAWREQLAASGKLVAFFSGAPADPAALEEWLNAKRGEPDFRKAIGALQQEVATTTRALRLVATQYGVHKVSLSE